MYKIINLDSASATPVQSIKTQFVLCFLFQFFFFSGCIHKQVLTGKHKKKCDKCKFGTDHDIKEPLLPNATEKKHPVDSFGESYKCLFCELKFDNMTYFEIHMRYFHSHDRKCPECGKQFSKFDVFTNHVKSHRDDAINNV